LIALLRRAFILQLHVMRTNPDYFLGLAIAPLSAVIFLSVVRHAGRPDLLPFALAAPVLMALWRTSIMASGEIVNEDRGFATMEPTIAAPAAYPTVILGRIAAVSAVGLLGVPEVWLVARAVMGVTITVEHPVLLALTLVAGAFAMSGTAVVMAAVFALGRNARIFQQTLTYPFYVLGGILVPVSVLPFWLRPFSRLVFLSWTADLLRASLSPAPVDDAGLRLAAIVALGLAGFAGGTFLLRRVLDRVRHLGTITYA
jgi:ABC-2 type transport system permease protein